MTTVFNDLATALNGSRQFSFSADYTQNITAARQAFNDYANDVDAGKEPQEAFNHILETGNDALIEYASQYGVTSKNLDTFIGNQAKAQVSLMAENTTLTNVSSLIHGYNNSVEATGLSQQKFASAVMATNGSLGQYLIGLNGAEASMRGYLGQVIATTAATVAMRAVTMALNAVIGMAVSWLINKAIQAWDDYIHRVDNAKAALDEFEDKNKELVSDLDKQRKTIDDLSDSYFDLAKGVDSATGKNISLSTEDYNEFIQMNEDLADAFPELIYLTDEYGNRFVDLGDNVAYAKQMLEEIHKQEEENYQYEQYKNLPEMFKNEQVVMDDIQGSVNELEADLARSTATLAQMQEAVNFTSGDMINVMAEYGDDAATAYAQAFRNTYVEAMNEAIANGDSDLANKLNDALLDTSTDGQYSFAVNLSSLGEEERKYLQKYFENFKGDYAEELNDSIADINKQLDLKRKEYDSEWQRILPTLVGSAKYMATEETQDLAAAFVGSLSSDIYEEIKDRPIEAVMREWLGDISKLSVDDRLKLESLLDTSLSPEERVRIYEELQASLNEKNLTLPVELVVKDDKDLMDRVEASKWEVSETVLGYNKVNDFFSEQQIDTAEEYNRWLEAVARAQGSLNEAIRLYIEDTKAATEATKDLEPTLVGAATTLNTKIKPATDALADLYKTIFYSSDGRNATGAFDISKLDPSQLASIKENLVTNLKELGIEFDDAENKVNEFFAALSDPNANKASVQNAFNKILTEYFYAADGLSDLSEETADGLKKMLKALDITNADEVVDNAIKDISKVNDALKAASQMDFDSRIKDAEENLRDELAKLEDPGWGISAENIQKVKDNTIQSVFGNVDMDKRTVIHWSDEVQKTWEDELKSWGYDPMAEGVSIDTVRGESSAYFLGDKEIEVAFTPIMVDKDGNNPQYLSQGTVDGYIQTILDEADKEVKKSGEKYSEEAVIEKAIELDFKGKTVDEIDSEGKQVGQQFVHGLIAGIGDEAIEIGSLMHFAGDFGAKELAEKQLEAYQSLKEKAAQGTLDLTNLTAAEIEVLKNEGYVTGAVAKQMALLALQKQLTGETPISTSQQVQALYNLGIQAGMTAAELAVLNDIMRDLDMADNVEKYDTKAAEAIRTQAKAKLDTFAERVQETLNATLIYGPANTESAKGAGKDAGDAYVEAFEKELKNLEEQRDAGIISEKEFLDKYKALIEKYFKDVDGYGEEYAKRMGDYFQRAISYYESIFSAVGTLLDHRIKAAQEGKDAAVDALNEEKDAALAAYDAQLEAIDELIDAKQDELDQLQEEHEARQRNINLQKAQYELQKAQNQRTKLIYKGGQLVYENDKSAVRDAKENVENAEYENAVAEIEKEIKALEKQREEIEKNREAAEKYYTKLIEDTEKYWDSIIEALEKQKSKWEELAEIKEIANAYALIQEAGESLGYSVEDILNDVPGAFEAFRDAYIGILQDANSENSNFLDGLSYATSTAKESVNSALGEIAGKASEVDKALEPLGEVSSKVEDTATALGNVATNSGTAASNVSTLSSSLDSAAGASEDISKIDSSVQSIASASLSDTVQSFKDLAGALKDCANALGIGEGEISAFESAVDALSKISLGNDNEGAIGSFKKLAGAVGAVASAIGGGASGGGASGDPTESQEPSMSDGAGGLISAIEGVKEATKTYIGENSGTGDKGTTEGGDQTEGGGTAISDFDALAGSVAAVVTAIGNAKDDYAEDGTSLVNAIKGLPEAGAEAIMGADGIKGMFEELLQVISECAEKASDLLKSIHAFKASGGYDLIESEQYTGNVHINAHANGNVHGNAYASGRLGLKKSENALVGELGQELVFNPATGTYRTVGDHGPEITRLSKGDLIFNAEQTKAIIKHGKHGGNSYANGSGLMPLSDAEKNMFKTMGEALTGIKADTSQMLDAARNIVQNINKVTTNNISPTINISGTQFTVQGVNGEAVMRQIEQSFSGMVARAYQEAMT